MSHYPADADPQEIRIDGDVLGRLTSGTAVKAFLPPESRCGTCILEDPDGRALQIRWDPELIPYLGLWWDNGLCAEGPVIAVEPTTGYGDDAAIAIATGRILQLEPGRDHIWWIEVSGGPDLGIEPAIEPP